MPPKPYGCGCPKCQASDVSMVVSPVGSRQDLRSAVLGQSASRIASLRLKCVERRTCSAHGSEGVAPFAVPPPLYSMDTRGSVVGAGPGSDTPDATGSKHHYLGALLDPPCPGHRAVDMSRVPSIVNIPITSSRVASRAPRGKNDLALSSFRNGLSGPITSKRTGRWSRRCGKPGPTLAPRSFSLPCGTCPPRAFRFD